MRNSKDYSALHPDTATDQTATASTKTETDVPQPSIGPPAYPFSHPKAYVGVVPAVETTASRTEARDTINSSVIGAPDRALRGAARLNLVTLDEANNPQLTARGETILRLLCLAHGTPEQALAAIDDQHGSQDRFIASAPEYATIADHLQAADPALAYFVSLLSHAYQLDEFSGPYTLPTLVVAAARLDLPFTVATFLRNTAEARRQVLSSTPDGSHRLRIDALSSPDVYRGTTTQQLRSMLYHWGVLDEPGTDVGRLEPGNDIWHKPTTATSK
jgi:hypothetical protein